MRCPAIKVFEHLQVVNRGPFSLSFDKKLLEIVNLYYYLFENSIPSHIYIYMSHKGQGDSVISV